MCRIDPAQSTSSGWTRSLTVRAGGQIDARCCGVACGCAGLAASYEAGDTAVAPNAPCVGTQPVGDPGAGGSAQRGREVVDRLARGADAPTAVPPRHPGQVELAALSRHCEGVRGAGRAAGRPQAAEHERVSQPIRRRRQFRRASTVSTGRGG